MTMQLADLIQAITQVAEYAHREPGSSVVQQADLIAANVDLIEQAITVAHHMRHHGAWRPSSYDGWWTVHIEVPNGIQAAGYNICERIRL
jgi:hypothetical protein